MKQYRCHIVAIILGSFVAVSTAQLCTGSSNCPGGCSLGSQEGYTWACNDQPTFCSDCNWEKYSCGNSPTCVNYKSLQNPSNTNNHSGSSWQCVTQPNPDSGKKCQ